MACHAEGEVVLQLLARIEAGMEDVLPTGENAQEAVGRKPKFEEAAGLGGG
jgi:hypothetical protein